MPRLPVPRRRLVFRIVACGIVHSAVAIRRPERVMPAAAGAITSVSDRSRSTAGCTSAVPPRDSPHWRSRTPSHARMRPHDARMRRGVTHRDSWRFEGASDRASGRGIAASSRPCGHAQKERARPASPPAGPILER
jgi:hypothetical protein